MRTSITIILHVFLLVFVTVDADARQTEVPINALKVKVVEEQYGLRLTHINEHGPFANLTATPSQNRGSASTGDEIVYFNGKRTFKLSDLHLGLASTNAGQQIPLTLLEKASRQYSTWMLKIPNSETARNVDPTSVDTTTNPERKICILLCGVTDDATMGLPSTKNLAGLRDVFLANVLDKRIRCIERLDGRGCESEAILDKLSKMDVKPQDTLIVYLSAHGAYDEELAESDTTCGGHFFDLGGSPALDLPDLIRKNLFASMKGKGARLTVLFSDSCNKMAPQPRPEGGGPDSIVGSPPYRTEYSNLEKLLLFYRGEIDINAAAKGEFAWADADIRGGWFTNELCAQLPHHDDWEQLFSSVRQDTCGTYKSIKRAIFQKPGKIAKVTLTRLDKQDIQTPTAFRLDVNKDGFPEDG